MSPSITDESTYPTGRTAPYDSHPFNAQPTSSHRLELGPPQRRRVNPESLAARLGPELVAEMEKHIIPGSIEMPPFSIRRDIQIKFGIDRRHIYDFFHSRGLRCLNEKTMRNSYLEIKTQRPTRIDSPVPAAFPEPRKRRAAAAALEATSASLKRSHAPRKQKGRQKRLERTPPPAKHERTTNTPREISESFLLEPEPEIDSQMTDMADMAQESLSSESSDAPFLLSGDSCAPFLGQFSTLSSETEESDFSSCFSASSLFDLNPPVSTPTLSTSPSTTSTLSSACEIPDSQPKGLPLTSQERQAHYAWLDGIIGPASGIQESMGTYKAFMEHQREVYYNRLLITEQPKKETVRRRATNEPMSWLRGTLGSGMAAHESPPYIATAPRVNAGLTRRTIRFPSSGCWSSPGPSLPGRTDADICGHSRTTAALSVPQANSHLGYPITRHTRRRTFSATVDM